MIWASQLWVLFCWLYTASLSLATKNVINLILVFTIWWCPCVKSSLLLLRKSVCYDHWVLWQHLYYACFTSERNSFLETLCLVAFMSHHLTWNSPRVSPHRCQSVSSVNQMRCDMQVDGPSAHSGLLDPWTCAHSITNKSQSAATLTAVPSQGAQSTLFWHSDCRPLCLLENGPQAPVSMQKENRSTRSMLVEWAYLYRCVAFIYLKRCLIGITSPLSWFPKTPNTLIKWCDIIYSSVIKYYNARES